MPQCSFRMFHGALVGVSSAICVGVPIGVRGSWMPVSHVMLDNSSCRVEGSTYIGLATGDNFSEATWAISHKNTNNR